MTMKKFNFNKAIDSHLNEFLNDPFSKKYKQYNKEDIKVSVEDLYKNQSKISYIDGEVYAMYQFYPGDVIEICPCKMIDNEWVENEVKELAFETENGKYAIPFGYVEFYKLSDEANVPNCDYEFDPNNETIIVRATDKIKKGDILCLDSRWYVDDGSENKNSEQM